MIHQPTSVPKTTLLQAHGKNPISLWQGDAILDTKRAMTRAIMLQGTGSDVGKTVLVAGLCRLARNKGIKVKPFKPQNMSNNAAVADDGGEIGRAQWLQAFACGAAPSVHMNPVLLKPQSEYGSQIIVQGKVWGEAKGRDYQLLKPQLMDAVLKSYELLKKDADLIIVEGAGSPAEINLRAGDIANMGFATKVNVPVVLVGDIDRGGVIAALVGTHAILPEEDRRMISGFIINKFRGDVSLFDDGIAAVRQHTRWPCFGVVPWLNAASRLPPEDSVALDYAHPKNSGRAKIAVLVLDRISNFDDFEPLRSEPGVELVMVKAGTHIPQDAALIIVPGSKSTISDLAALRRNGWEEEILTHNSAGRPVLGICGGYQMLGKEIADPQGLEGAPAAVKGLGLLDIETRMEPKKAVRNVEAFSEAFSAAVNGYEIHIGQSSGPDCTRPFSIIGDRADGAISADGRVFGTYLHGLFASDAFRVSFLRKFGLSASADNYWSDVDSALDEIADKLDRLGLGAVLDRARAPQI
jgi:adenosylcobyric acid synthase